MNKKLLALAVMAAAGAAQAQTSVVIDGSIDTSVINRAQANGASVTGLASSQRNTNYIGISGTEDIGGGLKGIFQIRTNFGSDATTNATATTTGNTGTTSIGDQNVWVGLQGGFGSVKLGRDLTPQFNQVSAYSTFGTGFLNNRSSMNTASTDARWNNTVQYMSNSIAGFQAQIMVAPRNEVGAAANAFPSTSTNGTVFAGTTNLPTTGTAGVPVSARVTYGAGPFSAGLAATRNGNAGPDVVWNLGGSFNAGFATLKAQYERDQNDRLAQTGVVVPGGATTLAASGRIGNAWLVAAEGGVPGTALVLRGQYAKRNTVTLNAPFEKAYGVGADYNLSKRTVAYLYYGKFEQAVGTTATNVGSNRDTVLGVRHAF